MKVMPDDINVVQSDLEARLREAVDNWDPHRPRRWLAKYGGWRVERRTSLTKQYCELRDATRALLERS